MHAAVSAVKNWGPRRIVVGVVIGIVVLVAGGAAIDLLHMRAELESGRDQLDDLDIDTIRERGFGGTVGEAAQDLSQASDIADSSPFLTALAPLPVVGDQVEAIRDLATAADTLGRAADTTGRRVEVALDDAGARPRDRVELLDVVAEELDRIERLTTELDVGAEGRLLPPVRDVRESFVTSLEEIPDRLGTLRAQVVALRDLIAGPTDYLVMVGNNAEMRAGAAMPLQIGVATIDDGDIELSDFKAATGELFTETPTGTYNSDIDAALARTYPNWLLGMDFPETAVVPDFPRTAPIFADIADDTQRWITSGVIHIDAIALAELLDVVGPITVDGTEYDSETAPQLVLNQTYIDFDGVPRALRRDAQSDLAKKLFEAIEEREVELLDIVAALQRAAEGRHLMAWSRDPILQDMFSSLEIDGDVTPFDTLVSVQNTAANKLDWYLDAEVDVTAVAAGREHWRVTVDTTVIHPERELTVDYIEGPYFDDGTHRMLLTVQVPAAATGLTMPDESVSEFGHDGTSQVIGTRFTLGRGRTRTVTTTYLLPKHMGGIRVLPSARVRPVSWSVNGHSFDDRGVAVVGFGPFPDPSEDDWMWTAAIGVLVAAVGTGTIVLGARRSGQPDRVARLTTIDNLTGALLIGVGFLFVVVATLSA